MKLDKSSARPIYLQLETIIRHQIETGVFMPGDKLPTEIALSKGYNISRMTARRALDALVTEGILIRQPGKGTFVADDKVPFAASTLTSFSRTMRGLGLAVTSKVIDLYVTESPPRTTEDLQLAENESVVFLRRVRYINDEAMAIMSSYMPAGFYEALQAADLSREPITDVMEAASGLHIVKSEDYYEASLARAEEADLLDIQVGAPVLLGRGVLYDITGKPVRASKVIYRGDRFRISQSASCAETEIKVPLTPHAEAEAQWLKLSFDLTE